MTPRADFYILPQADEDSLTAFICRICDKALDQGLKVHIHTRDPDQLQRLDRLLWSFRPDSFLPHAPLDGTQTTPITLGLDTQRPPHRELFINAANELPDDAFEFARIAEVVIQEPTRLESTRHNYQRCREHGFDLTNHDLRQRRA